MGVGHFYCIILGFGLLVKTPLRAKLNELKMPTLVPFRMHLPTSQEPGWARTDIPRASPASW